MDDTDGEKLLMALPELSFYFLVIPPLTAKIYLCDVSTESGMFSVSFLLSYFCQ